jgi:hypothetical protein
MAEHDDHDQIARDFHGAVNMAPAALERWLETEESKSVGWAGGTNKHDAGGPESVGHKEGRRIIEIKHKRKADLTDDDYAHMKKVVGYVHRHMAQKPTGDVEHTRWRYSLMNWGHDPLK